MDPQDKREDKSRSQDESQQGGRNDGGHTGEGAASALRQLISQSDRYRHAAGEADDAAGHGQ